MDKNQNEKYFRDLRSNVFKSANIFYLCFSSIFINFLSLASPLLILQTYDRIIPNNAKNTLSILIIGVLLFLVLEIILKMARLKIVNWSRLSFEHNATLEALKRFLYLKKENDTFSKNQVLKILEDIKKIGHFHSGQFIISVIDFPFIILYLIFIYIIGKELVLIPISIIFLLLIFIIFQAKIQNQLTETKENSEEKFNSFILNTFHHLNGIKSLGLENIFLREFEFYFKKLLKTQHKTTINNIFSFDLGFLVSQLMTISVVTFGAIEAVNGNIGIGGLAACSILSNRISQPLHKNILLWKMIDDFKRSKKNFSKILKHQNLPNEKESKIENIGKFSLDEVHLKTSIKGKPKVLINNLNLELIRGDCISVSTFSPNDRKMLTDLFTGQITPTKGEILIENVSLQDIPSNELARYIGYLSPKSEIFKGSIWENMEFFGSAQEVDVKKAALKLGIDRSIFKLSNGYETTLEGGSSDKVSAGLKQRIGIARALALKPRIVIFENADNSLDRNEYNYLLSLLGKLKSKIVLIVFSEDKNFIRLAETNFIFSDGRLINTQTVEGNRLMEEHRRSNL